MSCTYGIELAWPYEGKDVYVVGSWSDWRDRVYMGEEKRVRLQLPRGFHTYKFVVDGRWFYDMLRPQATDDCGNINNVLCVPRGEIKVQMLPFVTVNREEIWNAQREACVHLLSKRRPAVICTQRGKHEQLAYVCQRAGPYRRTGLPQSDSTDSYCAILWDSVQLLHVASGDFWLSDKPNMRGSRFPEAPEPCMATWALLRPYFPGDSGVFVCSVALDSPDSTEELRAKQGAVLADQINRLMSAIASGEIRDQGTQQPVRVAAVVLSGRFGEHMFSQDGKTKGKLYDILSQKGFFDCYDLALNKVFPESFDHRSTEDWVLVLKRRCEPSSATDSVTVQTQLPISWTPASRTDIAQYNISASKGKAIHTPGCEEDHIPLSATFVITDLPYTPSATS